MSDKIDLIHDRAETASLPVEKVDVIVSEWMGYFLLFEGMLDSVLVARDRFLRTDGLMLPNRCALRILGVSDLSMFSLWHLLLGCFERNAATQSFYSTSYFDKSLFLFCRQFATVSLSSTSSAAIPVNLKCFILHPS